MWKAATGTLIKREETFSEEKKKVKNVIKKCKKKPKEISELVKDEVD